MNGKVYFIGSGPGDIELITVRGKKILENSDIIFYDRLVEKKMLNYALHSNKIYVGKCFNKLSIDQCIINKKIIFAALRYKIVVRLKGGDPMLFSRIDEEMRFIEKFGIDYEIVPGITSAFSCSALLRRSLTLRNISRSVLFITYRKELSIDIYSKISSNSLVFYMNRNNIFDISKKLIISGKKKSTPAIIIISSFTNNEYSFVSTLDYFSKVNFKDVLLNNENPALFIVGMAFF